MAEEYIVKVLPDEEVETVADLIRCQDCNYSQQEWYGLWCEQWAHSTDNNGFCHRAINDVEGEA